MTPAADVALSRYVMARLSAVESMGMFLTTSWAVVLSVTWPMLVAPDCAARVIVSVAPAGNAELSRAVILLVLSAPIVLVLYLVVASVTPVGLDPATAVVIVNDPGDAVTDINGSCAFAVPLHARPATIAMAPITTRSHRCDMFRKEKSGIRIRFRR